MALPKRKETKRKENTLRPLWISVKKSRPEEIATVMVSLNAGLVTIGFRMGKDEWGVALERIWLSPDDDVDVTPWMPLPNAVDDEPFDGAEYN